MSYLALARKWRPRTFEQMAGQEHVRRALINGLESGRVHHAYLFTGTRGVGKTTVARILAKALNCERGVSAEPCGVCDACQEIDSGRFVDLIEVDAASRTKVDDTRDLLDNAQYSPAKGRYKVYLIDEVHMLSASSFNALLKTLEEPPPHVKFLLATTDPQKIPPTVLSRCLQFNLKRLPDRLIAERLEDITKQEDVEFESRAVALLARSADGSMRDALSLLDQAIAFGDGHLDEAEVRTMLGTIDQDHVVRLLDCLASADARGLIEAVEKLDEFVPDYAGVLDDLATVLQRIALIKAVPDAVDETRLDALEVTKLAQRMSAEDVQLCYQIAVIGRRDLPLAPDPRTGFEMVLLRMLAFRPQETRRTSSSRQESHQVPPGVASGESAKESRSSVSPEWARLIDQLDIRGAPRQLAANCSLERREGNVFYLRLDDQSNHLLTRQLQDKLQAALEKRIGDSVKLNFTVGETEEETLAQRAAREADNRLQAARASIDADPNVRALKETFGATVQSESVKPLDLGDSGQS